MKSNICVFFFQKFQDKLKVAEEELGHEIRVFSSTTFESIPSTLPRADQGTKLYLFLLYYNHCLYGSCVVTLKHGSCRGRRRIL